MKGDVIVISGISGAGKSTLAAALKSELESRGRTVRVMDGDSCRHFFSGALLYSPSDRLMVSKVLGYGASLLADAGIDVILATMFSQPGARDFVKERVPFVEIFLDAPLDDCINKDVKQLYAERLAAEKPELVGVDLVFDSPPAPDLVVPTHRESVEASLERIVTFLRGRQLCGL